MSKATLLNNINNSITQYNYHDPHAFGTLLSEARFVFPAIDKEIAGIYNISVDTVRLWMTGSIIPDLNTQQFIINILNRKANQELSTQKIISEQPSLTVASQTYLIKEFPEVVPFYLPWIAQLNSWVSGFVRSFGCYNTSMQNFAKLAEATTLQKEELFKLKLNKKIGKCNKAVLKAIRKNETSLFFKVGKKTVENVRMANCIKHYLIKTKLCIAEVTYDYVLIDGGAVLLEIAIL